SMPERILMSVDFPAPFSPMMAWTSPGRTSKSMENRTGISPKDLEIRCADRIGGTSASGASFVSISPPRAGLLDAALLPCNRCKGFHDRCKGLHRIQTVYACVQRAGPGSRRPPAARVPDLRAGAGGGAPGCN